MWLAVVVGVVTVSGLWATSLQGCDEAYYAHMARTMLESGDWLVPRYDGHVPFDKPPLLMWLVAASFRAFGVGDLQARLPLLVLGASLPWALRAGLRGPDPFRFAAAATLSTTLLYVQLQHQVMTDLVAFAGLVAMALAVFRAEEGPRWGWLAGFGVGIALLAKGALGVLFVLASLPGVLARRQGVLRAGFLVRCIPGLVPAAAWYGVMVGRFGQQFLDVHFGVFLVRLATEGIGPQSPLGPAFYPVSALWRLAPWWPVVPAALALGWQRAREGDPVLRWAVGFCAVYFTAITALRTKADHYALPLVLPLAVLVGRWATDIGPASRADRVAGVLYAGFAGLLVVAALLASSGLLPALRPVPAAAVGLGLGLSGGLAACGLLAWRGKRAVAWACVLAVATLAYAVAAALARPQDAEPDLRALAAAVPRTVRLTYVRESGPEFNLCPYLALRFRQKWPPAQLPADRFPHAGPGWYAGRRGVLVPLPGDRVVFRGRDWILVHRP